ncbi:Transcription-associated protein 1 [Neolecta irregularis DAH-3]|uniref:Transcription-associated protein 1 n=1 Tax=Neolecta irregularis (strain DAH-3) TaxID=1198029 RepID=A0A1U7LJR1_NEOID|nr:Transcription-associated protein 1 [Neolecta irregularis DAH-3]|eukprot:OLL22884.1 Transcription-associated protein 1 [Neolecta irregularis DAH-3]
MGALYDHLKPLPHHSAQHSHGSLRILGKLGGRNRRFLSHPKALGYHLIPVATLEIEFSLHGAPTISKIDCAKYVDLAVRTLQNSRIGLELKEQALRLLISAVKLLMRSVSLPPDFAASLRHKVQLFFASESTLEDTPTVSGMSTQIPDADIHASSGMAAAQRSVLKDAIFGCLLAEQTLELQQEASRFLKDIYEHFTLIGFEHLLKGQSLRDEFLFEERQEIMMSFDVIVDVIIQGLASDFGSISDSAMQAIRHLFNTVSLILGSPAHCGRFPMFQTFARKLCHACAEENWFQKIGGCLGIRVMLQDLELGEDWFFRHHVDFTRAVLFVLKDMPQESPLAIINQAKDLVIFILQRSTTYCTDISRLSTIIGMLVAELSNSNPIVRSTVQTSLLYLAESSGTAVKELIIPVKDRVFVSIFTKPLRALPLAMQIGYIDAVDFCLSLGEPLLELNDEMMRLLHEVLALADAEDSALVNDGGSLPKYKTETSLAELRIACIKLLSTAISLPDSSAQQNQTKGRTISVFFKSLYAKHPDIVAVASCGLRQVLVHNQKLPKDLLQAGLRPILMNLSDHKRLSTTGLEGLARLLELLTNYFKVEIGRKLLDHLPAWAESNVLHQAALRPLEEHQNIKIVVAIINVFHLLPPTANMFLADLIDQVLMLEETLRRTQTSPFRLPLYKFLNRYSEETWLFIKTRLDDNKYQRLLWQALSHKISEPLRDVVGGNISEIIQREGPVCISDLASATICGIHVLKSLLQHNPACLGDQKDNLHILLQNLTQAMRLEGQTEYHGSGRHLAIEQAFEVLIKLHFQLVEFDPNEIDKLFALAESILSVAPNYADLYRVLFTEYTDTASQPDKAKILLKCIELFPKETTSHDVKYFVFHYILNPQIASNLDTEGSAGNIVDKTMVELIHSNIWEPALSDYGKDKLCSNDFLRVELLQLSALIVKNRPFLVKEVRKDVIKFAWNYIKIEDVMTKQAAYVLIAYFIAAFETPVKIVTQIYVALLKSHQADGKILVRQALDILAAVLPQRLGASGDGRASHWAKWPSRLIQEDGQSVSQLMNIYHFMARHADMFYDFRDVYTLHIVASLPKLGFVTSSNTETKALSLDLIELIIRWEQRRNRDNANTSPSSASDSLRDSILTHLVHFCLSTDFANRKTLTMRALFLLRILLEGRTWPVADTKLGMFERNLIQTEYSDTTAPIFSSTMETLEIICLNQTESWLLDNLRDIQKLLTPVIRIEAPALQEYVLKIAKRFYQITLADQMLVDENSVRDFEAFIVTVVQDLLQSSTNLSLLVGLLSILVEARPDIVDANVTGLMKIFQKLAKDHISTSSQVSSNVPAINPDASVGPSELDKLTASELTLKTIDIARRRISVLGDQRRTFLTVIVQLLEKSADLAVCHKLFDMIKAWVLDKSEPFPTVKEKTAVLLKIPTLEHKGDHTLINQFLELIIHVYEDESLARTELTVRLENAFLMGTRAEDYQIRNRFMTIFDGSMSRNVFNRLNYVIALQDWESLATHYWLKQAVQILSGSVKTDSLVQLKSLCISNLASLAEESSSQSSSMMVDDALERFSDHHRDFVETIPRVSAGDLLEPIARLQHLDVNYAHMFWIDLFPMCWAAIGKTDRSELTKALVTLLAREYHIRQMDKRPNIIKTLMEAISCSFPVIHLPSHLTKYLGKTFDSWYVALELLQNTAFLGDSDELGKRDNYLDALAELYALLSEDDMFYGLWRRRCKFTETNTAQSYEQIGMWEAAQQMYENAQIKARTGAIPFSESEYELWEDHWVLCAQKLQQWDILTDLAKHENFSELLLECAWRITDWTTDRETLEAALKLICDQPSPRRCVFEAFLALQRAQVRGDSSQEFNRICEEGMQLSLRRWNNLPAFVNQAHTPLLQTFQQFVELQEASQIYAGLLSTQTQNLETKSQELKSTLQSWRERLPNTWDDMTAWSDLVAWRQLVFATINRTYMPLVSNLPQSANSNANSYAYRGYHETAWIINRFAHVARKHQLPGVCINQLTKIYTLPNIEIQEAFLKLREQAKCHYQNPAELSTGLDVISNTNLVYFGVQQKAEFFTLKGMFLAALKMKDEASQAFATAIQIDITLGKAWAEWGRYNDRRFKENPEDLTLACHAVSCYLQAAGIYKNKKSRKLLNRVLWLLSLDDQVGNIAKGWESYKGEVPVWYWITFIPQLLTSLSHKEARYARQILIKIAKSYPQALHFQLRTTKEDYTIIKKQAYAAAQNATARSGRSTSDPIVKVETSPVQSNQNYLGNETNGPNPAELSSEQSPSDSVQAMHNGARTESPLSKSVQIQTRQPWEHVDEIMAILKTAFPLLALSMETMVDQIQQRLKCPADEDAYRLTVALLNDAIQYVGRAVTLTEDSNLPPATEANIVRFSETVVPKSLKSAFERDFIQQNLTLHTYILRLRQWRDRFELVLDKRQDKQYLEQVSPYLTEFQYQKFDDIEVPGQYLLHKDNNNDFIKILRFLPTLEVVRGNGICYRRLTIRGHDGSQHPFHVQYPAARHCRREERIVQFFRILNSALSSKRESRRRNLQYNLPTAVPLAPHIRIIQDDLSFVSFQGIYEEYCHKTGMHKDDPLKFYTQKVNAFTNEQAPQDLIFEKIEILEEIQKSMVSSSMLTDYVRRTYGHFEDYWLFRKQFCYQYATFTFMCYVMHIGNRFPHKISVSRATGNIWTSELLPSMAPNNPVFHLSEAVPFRFTSNVQNFMGPVGIEGIFSFALMAIAKCLTEPQFELDQYLCIFVRDELITWFTQQHRPVADSPQLRDCVATNVDMVVRRAVSLSQVAKPNIPANQTIIDLISLAVNPKSLAGMDPLWMSWVA